LLFKFKKYLTRVIDINCDMGEGMENEADLMPYISSANIACGYHAGDTDTMRQVITLCLQHNVHIGAHPSFSDRENFGRTAMQLPGTMLYDLISAQLAILNNIVIACGAKLRHVKPHGALYNMASRDRLVARAIAQAVKDFDSGLTYVGLSGSIMIDEAKQLGLHAVNEVFADRTYQQDGSLTPRAAPNALLGDVDAVKKQVEKFVKDQRVKTVTGEEIPIIAETICIHGDGPYALEFAKAIYKMLHEK
jgi:UPF0271 protein